MTLLRRRHLAAGRHLDLARHACSVFTPARARPCPIPSRPGSTGDLVGGLYGVALGRVFFGESMFSTERDAIEGRAARPGADVAREQRRADRLPGRQSRTSSAWARVRFPDLNSSRASRGASRTSDRRPAGPRCWRPRTANNPLAGSGIVAMKETFMQNSRGFSGRREGACRRKRRFKWKGGCWKPCPTRVPRSVAERSPRDRPHLRQDA